MQISNSHWSANLDIKLKLYKRYISVYKTIMFSRVAKLINQHENKDIKKLTQNHVVLRIHQYNRDSSVHFVCIYFGFSHPYL